MSAGQLRDGVAALAYALAGNARLTLVSGKTGARFTFRVRAAEQREGDARPPVHFVSVLTGEDNEGSYTFLGTIFPARPEQSPAFVHGKKSRIGRDAPSARAFAWAWSFLARVELPPGCEVWHEGTCGRCGRPLTVPESISSGLGPVCAGKEAA